MGIRHSIISLVLSAALLPQVIGYISPNWAEVKTLTNTTLDSEGTGNVLGTVSKILLPFASCVGATAFLNSDDYAGVGPAAPTAACNDGGVFQRPSADFSGSAANQVQFLIKLPSDWNSSAAVSVVIRYVTDAASPTGNVEWDIEQGCASAGDDWSPTGNGAETITDAVGADEALNDATLSPMSMTGCVAGDDMLIIVSRDGTNDTNNDIAKALHFELTLRRSQ